MAAAPLWTAKCSYLTDTGTIYANVKNVHKDIIVNRFFGIFFMFFQSSLLNIYYLIFQKDSFNIGQIWGNLISYFILKPEEKESNGTLINEFEKYDKCGADFSEKEYKGAEVINHIERRTV